MSPKKSISKAKRTDGVAITDLARRIVSLRESLGSEAAPFSRAELAKVLGANRAQVARWEIGTELPSTEKIIAMALCARRLEDKMWFWRKAISESGMILLQGDLQREAEGRLRSLDELREADCGKIRTIRVIEGFTAGSHPRELAAGELHISASLLAGAGDPVGLIAQPKLRYLGKVLPPPLRLRDMVIVDRALIRPADLLRGTSSQMVALQLPRIPMTIGKDFVGYEETESYAKTETDPQTAEMLMEMASPVVLFGYLSEEPAADVNVEVLGERSNRPPARNLWRLMFSAGTSLRIALTNWESDKLPRDLGAGVPLLNQASIFGAVVGWMREPRGSWGSAAGDAEQKE